MHPTFYLLSVIHLCELAVDERDRALHLLANGVRLNLILLKHSLDIDPKLGKLVGHILFAAVDALQESVLLLLQFLVNSLELKLVLLLLFLNRLDKLIVAFFYTHAGIEHDA